MEELQRLQSERLQRLCAEHGISQKELAKQLKVSPTSVNHWFNGKVHMSDYNARLICELYPDYSPEYLRGYAEYPNGKAQLIAENWSRIHEQRSVGAAVGVLIAHAGFEFTGFKDFQPDVEGFALQQLTRLEDGASLEIPQGQLDDFNNEVCAYVGMRLNLMFGKGCR